MQALAEQWPCIQQIFDTLHKLNKIPPSPLLLQFIILGLIKMIKKQNKHEGRKGWIYVRQITKKTGATKVAGAPTTGGRGLKMMRTGKIEHEC